MFLLSWFPLGSPPHCATGSFTLHFDPEIPLAANGRCRNHMTQVLFVAASDNFRDFKRDLILKNCDLGSLENLILPVFCMQKHKQLQKHARSVCWILKRWTSQKFCLDKLVKNFHLHPKYLNIYIYIIHEIPVSAISSFEGWIGPLLDVKSAPGPHSPTSLESYSRLCGLGRRRQRLHRRDFAKAFFCGRKID